MIILKRPPLDVTNANDTTVVACAFCSKPIPIQKNMVVIWLKGDSWLKFTGFIRMPFCQESCILNFIPTEGNC